MAFDNIRKRTSARLLALGVAPLLALMACGGAAGPGSSAGSKEAIKVGLEYPHSGGFATNGNHCQTGAMLAVA